MSQAPIQLGNSPPKYGVPFRMDDYRSNPTVQQFPQPVKTQRRQQQEAMTQQPQPKPFPQPISMPITETKLTAGDMAVLIQRRLPADKLSGISNQTEFSQNKPTDKHKGPVIINEPMLVMASNDEIKENANPNIGTSNQWKCVKYACCCMCGCTICTSTLGLIIALYYEWLG